ncbi:germination protein [Lentibacillus kapialis]|uniref:Germination protein n=1 Tax=Lentibacillus kapialis TaxID=340214 RepID=A0A917PX02_9BACI|nr:endospore germination permease [Lentibacillus kapialis]GGJ96426.1 germination protein [Lentibacillus kapialis]
MEKGRISALQMAILMYPTILATAILTLPATTAAYADRDMWLSPFWGSLAGFLAVYNAYKLNTLYRKETLIQYSQHIIGFIPGKVLGFFYIFYFLHNESLVVKQYGDFVAGIFLPETPMIVVNIAMVVVCGFAVRGGLETVARTAQIFIPVSFLLWIIVIILLIPELELTNMLPIMENGIMPSIKGAYILQSWFSLFIMVAFLLPFLKNHKKGLKWGMYSVTGVLFTMVITNLATLLIFGNMTSNFLYPVMDAARYVSLADFLQHIEALVMAIWVSGTFIKITVFYYVVVLGTAHWLKLSDYRPIVLPIGFLIAVFTVWTPGMQVVSQYFATTSIIYSVLFQTILPLLLLIVAVFRVPSKS